MNEHNYVKRRDYDALRAELDDLRRAYDNEQHVMRRLQLQIDNQADHIRRARDDAEMWEARAEHAGYSDDYGADWERICPECVAKDHGSCSGEPCSCPCEAKP